MVKSELYPYQAMKSKSIVIVKLTHQLDWHKCELFPFPGQNKFKNPFLQMANNISSSSHSKSHKNRNYNYSLTKVIEIIIIIIIENN